ncbi:MAG: DUF4912 domain-containing protein [Pseudanabaenaceae cyanobacterium bins.68]|nr:DUF4912 domain-containing protein [Pseudanabaenaceae cyanobacterium bins.68]
MAKERPPLEEMTLRQLRRVAQDFLIFRYSRMRKHELLLAIQTAQRANSVNQANHALENGKIMEDKKFSLGKEETVTAKELATVDANLSDFPSGYGESKICLLPRNPEWAYVYWDVPNESKQALRQQGGQYLALRLYDSTNINLEFQAPHSIQEYPCEELAREWHLAIPISDREYTVELGYRTIDGRWLVLCRSASVKIPPMFPSDWTEEHFITVPWDTDLRGQTLFTLVPPSLKSPEPEPQTSETQSQDYQIYDDIFNLARDAESQRVAGSLYGSMPVSGSAFQIESLSSYVFPSGAGMWTGAAAALTASGVNYSGIGMSGAGIFSGSLPRQPRQFWLIADAELIVYGATEPDATVTIAGRPIKLNQDGTFRFHMSFQDGVIDYPIFALAADGIQNRSIHMKFERQTLERRTNTKEAAIPEWIS